MYLMILGWILVISSIAMFALLLFPRRTTGLRTEQLNVETCKARLEEIEARLKLGNLDAAEADAAKLALLAQLRSSRWGFGQDLLPAARKLTAPAVVLLVVVGVGAVASHVADAPEAVGSAETNSAPDPGSDSEMLASLADYTRSVGAGEAASTPADGNLLPDVNVMIERLAARLETEPGDVKGWRMLGWSYLNMERYEQAAAAYAKALELDPSSVELKRLYDEAKAKASNSANLQTGTLDKSGDEFECRENCQVRSDGAA